MARGRAGQVSWIGSPIALVLPPEGVEAIAVCYLHAYANTAHEAGTLAEIAKLWPEVSAVVSHQITREWREYERSSTTVLSAYVQPAAARYLHRLDDGLKAQGFASSPYIMKSNCGVDSLESVARTPITMMESGPASGFRGRRSWAARLAKPTCWRWISAAPRQNVR